METEEDVDQNCGQPLLGSNSSAPSQKRIMKELESWFTGRTITKKVEEDLKKLKILDLVLAGKIKEAKEKLQEDIEKENIEKENIELT